MNQQITILNTIAQNHLNTETLETRNSDRLDFHEVSVWGVEQALRAAFEAGQKVNSLDQG